MKFNIWEHTNQLIKSFNQSYDIVHNIDILPSMEEIPVIELLSHFSMATVKTQQVSGYRSPSHEVVGFSISGVLTVIVMVVIVVLVVRCANTCNCVQKCALTSCMAKQKGLNKPRVTDENTNVKDSKRTLKRT